MFNEYKDGGLKMLDIQYFNDALKSKWLKYLMKQSSKTFLTSLLNMTTFDW